MQRIIKYRVWYMQQMNGDTEAKRLLYNESSGVPGASNSNAIFMQYIGKNDKNGKEIYEGDIVEVQGTKRIGRYTTFIIWKNMGFTIERNDTYLIDSACIFSKHTEILGNIYETPELLRRLLDPF